VRTVVEEHEHGACLFRVRARLRPSVVGAVRGTTLGVLVAIGTSASMFLYDPAVTVAVAAAGIAAIGARAAWQAIRAATVLDGAIARVADATGLVRLGAGAEVAAGTGSAAEAAAAASAVEGAPTGTRADPASPPVRGAAPQPVRGAASQPVGGAASQPVGGAVAEVVARAAYGGAGGEAAAEQGLVAAGEASPRSTGTPVVRPTRRRSRAE
jgi:hypothetical protein